MPAVTDPVLKRFLGRLKEEQTEFPRQTLLHPKNPTEFGFGEASGMLKGLMRAEQLFEEVIGEEEDRT
jgi:hypothetical protein